MPRLLGPDPDDAELANAGALVRVSSLPKRC
jgi:hypothetical protein